MNFEFFPSRKSPQELKKQAKSAEKVLGKEMYPPDMSVKDVLDVSNIKEKYKTRYEAYVATLRALGQGDLDTKEIQHAKEWITALNNLDNYIKEHESQDNPLLREKQFIVYKKIRDFLEQGKRKGYVKLPTGVGKTILFLKIAEALNMKTLVVSPSLVILNQNKKETEQFTASEYGEYHGGEKNLSKQVTHITYHSLVKAVRGGIINPEDYPVIILDEAHRALGPERAEITKRFGGLQLGFTATAEFSANKKVYDLLEEEIFRMDVAEGIREGLICDTQIIHAYTNVDLSSVNITKGEYDQEQLETVINVHGRNLAAVELYQKKFSHLKAFCTCSGITHAEEVARLFNEEGIPAACITGDTPKGDKPGQRDWILKEYKEGRIKVLTNARVLLEGFNEPSCSVNFNLHPTLSLVDAEQRVRSGRLDKSNPNKWSYVVDFIDQNAKKPQVLYSEILGTARVWDISEPKKKKQTKLESTDDNRAEMSKPPIDFKDAIIKGLKVEVDTEKIMEVTKRNMDFREKWTFDTLQADVRAKGTKTARDYIHKAPENKWPAFSTLAFMPEFPRNFDKSMDWDKFLGREKRKEWTFETLQADVRDKKIKSSGDYSRRASTHNWPSHRSLTSLPEFPKNKDGTNDWDMFLGVEKLDFVKLQADVFKKGIKTSKEYKENSSKNKWPEVSVLKSMPEFPKNPDNSPDWDTFLGREKFDFTKLQAEVRAQDLKSSTDYKNKATENRWPSPDTITRMPEFPKNSDGSNDWDTFLGREKRPEWTFKTLQKAVREADIKSSSEYDQNNTKNKWPASKTLIAMPEFPKNKDGINNWDKFLGREKWTFKTLQVDVRAKKIRSSGDYEANSSRYGWPVARGATSMPEFPKNPDGTNDWDTFLGRKKK